MNAQSRALIGTGLPLVDAGFWQQIGLDQDRLQRCSHWVRAWTPWVLVRWCWRHRLITSTLLVVAALLLAAARAVADPGTGASVSEGDPLISWMGIKDSYGVPVAKYTLTLNQGNWASSSGPVYAAFSVIDSFVYEMYVCLIATALWLIRFALSFDWLKLFTGPFETIGAGVNTAMNRFGLAATALAVLAIIVAFTALAGKTAKAFSHIAMGLLMVGLAATVFANPLAELVGPDGLLAKGRETGLQFAATVSGGTVHNKGTGADVDHMVSSLADRFLRSPTQMINFGMVSDSISRKCAEAWSSGIKNGHGDTLKDDMQGCDAKYGDAMHRKAMGNPGSILVALNMCGLLGAFLIAFACYFVWHVVRCAVHAMLFAALATPAFAIGVIPGGAQTFAWKTVLDCAMAYVAMIIYTAGFGAYNVVLDRVFAESKSNAIQAIFYTTLVLAFAFAFFGPLRRMFDRQRDTMAAKLGHGRVAGGSGRSALSKIADVAQIAELAGLHVRRGSKSATQPARIESESESAVSGGGSAVVTISDSAEATGETGGVGNSGQAGDEASMGVTSGSQAAPSSAKQVVYLDGERAAQAHDRLAEAIRIQRGNRGGGGGQGPSGPGSGGGRYSLPEAA